MSVIAWIAVTFLFLVAIVPIARKWLPRGSLASNHGSARVKAYPAVGVRYNLLACKAVQKYYDQRFLARDAPAFPVPGCNVRPCSCRYIHYRDRRAGEDRRVLSGIQRILNANIGGERRRNERRQMQV